MIHFTIKIHDCICIYSRRPANLMDKKLCLNLAGKNFMKKERIVMCYISTIKNYILYNELT
jgi:hypothetical protein